MPPPLILSLLYPCCLQSLRSYGALKICLQCHPQHSLRLPPPAKYSLPLFQCPPNMPTILLPHQPNPQRHIPSLRLFSSLKMRLQFCPHLCPLHSCLSFSATYNSYTPVAHSSYASETALNPPYA
ncbi:hypothetical protein O181_034594 [Austropuccinia psidii MF-1]|uniref:Uncharacterized protein n=1 Tax=Austropuccinia psidii MF-1 TaxID=1389203 RepID=A0A9Q3D121_9BASI|nr:hypothetical protein [Austropuccinia psidii MF-1]